MDALGSLHTVTSNRHVGNHHAPAPKTENPKKWGVVLRALLKKITRKSGGWGRGRIFDRHWARACPRRIFFLWGTIKENQFETISFTPVSIVFSSQ